MQQTTSLIHLVNKLFRISKAKLAMRKFESQVRMLDQNSVVIDCGANVGFFSSKMAKQGAVVYAFEPNRFAFSELVEKSKKYPNIKPINKAVGVKNSAMKLYMHKNSDEDPIKWSTGSSLLENKANIDKQNYVDVEVIDIIEFINGLKQRIDIIKIDIEGFEIDVLNKIIDASLYNKVGMIFVEVHDHKIPELVDVTEDLRQRIKRECINNINLDWQ